MEPTQVSINSLSNELILRIYNILSPYQKSVLQLRLTSRRFNELAADTIFSYLLLTFNYANVTSSLRKIEYIHDRPRLHRNVQSIQVSEKFKEIVFEEFYLRPRSYHSDLEQYINHIVKLITLLPNLKYFRWNIHGRIPLVILEALKSGYAESRCRVDMAASESMGNYYSQRDQSYHDELDHYSRYPNYVSLRIHVPDGCLTTYLYQLSISYNNITRLSLHHVGDVPGLIGSSNSRPLLRLQELELHDFGFVEAEEEAWKLLIDWQTIKRLTLPNTRLLRILQPQLSSLRGLEILQRSWPLQLENRPAQEPKAFVDKCHGLEEFVFAFASMLLFPTTMDHLSKSIRK
ncbi:hypothetical protein F5884DRAFT_429836 [Xylogone sp. PMI_703]|nr:hypothetical protein F5884DRAFT_429836 [Xylogone sp. PMI_703]